MQRQIPTIEVLDAAVTIDELGLKGALDTPMSGSRCNDPALLISGWVTRDGQSCAPIVIKTSNRKWHCESTPREDLRPLFGPQVAAQAGFVAEVWAHDISPDGDEIELSAEDNPELTFARLFIAGSKFAYPMLFPQHLESAAPLPGITLVSSLGRSGSSLLMQQLLRHPQIGGYAHPPYESRFLQLAAFRARFSISTVRPEYSRHNRWYSHAVDHLEIVEDEATKNTLDNLLVRQELAKLADIIIEYGRELAKIKPHLRTICEKSPVGTHPDFLGWFWPGCRIVLLIRDLRDMLCSYLSFDAKRGTSSFTKDLLQEPDRYFRLMRVHALQMRALADRFAGESKIITYEQLVSAPATTLASLFEHCRVQCNRNVVELCSGPADENFLAEHSTTSAPSASIGRWSTDFPDYLKVTFEKHLGDINELFGYPGGF